MGVVEMVSVKKVSVLFMGQVVDMPVRKAEYLVQTGRARFYDGLTPPSEPVNISDHVETRPATNDVETREPVKPHHVGGGLFEVTLPDGSVERVRGKAAAQARAAELQK